MAANLRDCAPQTYCDPRALANCSSFSLALRPMPMSAAHFFCQAEAGIRCLYVTGVQTCALPIYHVAQHTDAVTVTGGADAARKSPAPTVADEWQFAYLHLCRGVAKIGGLEAHRAMVGARRGDRKRVVEGKGVDQGGAGGRGDRGE